MVLIGIENNIVVLCVNIDQNQLQLAKEMYPDWILQEQTGEENIGWHYNNGTFITP